MPIFSLKFGAVALKLSLSSSKAQALYTFYLCLSLSLLYAVFFIAMPIYECEDETLNLLLRCLMSPAILFSIPPATNVNISIRILCSSYSVLPNSGAQLHHHP